MQTAQEPPAAPKTSPVTDTAPALAVVVISHGPRATLPAAVRSVLQQDVPVELLVVHTGPGDVPALLKAHGITAPVLAVPESRYVGAARNLGIAHTQAPWVAFLADDCLAAPEWARQRLGSHRDGSQAVASALLPDRPGHPVALASFLSNHIRRLPLTPPGEALRYGVSYERRLLLSVGAFREDMPGGEDSEYNARVATVCDIAWNPAVVTLHREPRNPVLAWWDHLRRGYLSGQMRLKLGATRFPPFRQRVRDKQRYILAAAAERTGPELHTPLRKARPLLKAYILAYELGIQGALHRHAPRPPHP